MDAAQSSEVDVLGLLLRGHGLRAVGGRESRESPSATSPSWPRPSTSRTSPAAQSLARGRIGIDELVDDTGNVPAESVYRSASSLRPTMDISKYATLWEKLWNDEFVEGFQAMGQWLRDQTPFPGACARQATDLLLRRNLMLTGEVSCTAAASVSRTSRAPS